jgi:hypothetical protein
VLPDADIDPRRYEALLAAVQRLVRAPGAERALADDAEGWLAQGGLGPDDTAQLAALGTRRLLLYRRHVHRGLRRAVRQEIPRTAARLGDAFDATMTRWIEEAAPSSRYFRDVAFELVAWAAPRWALDPALPSYLGDLGRHELTCFDVENASDAEAPGDAEIALDRGVRFSGSARLCRYDHAVHRLSAEIDARDVPERVPTAILAYRDEDHDARFLELTPLAAAILERLLRGERLGPAVVAASGELGHEVDPAVTGSTAALLEDLIARKAILEGEA